LGHNVFVTATDTDAGKSFVTAALTHALLSAGHDAGALKPVSCGREVDSLNDDVAVLLAAQGMDEAQAGDINLYDFADYTAPLFAAHADGQPVDAARLADWCRQHTARHALTLIEAVGGLMTPLAEGLLVSDWLHLLPQARVLLVVRARLGGINQALLTLDKLRRMQRNPGWVVVNAVDEHGESMLEDHCAAIAPYLGGACRLLQLPHLPQAGEAQRYLSDSLLLRDMPDAMAGVAG